jgi:hypothetical protein
MYPPKPLAAPPRSPPSHRWPPEPVPVILENAAKAVPQGCRPTAQAQSSHARMRIRNLIHPSGPEPQLSRKRSRDSEENPAPAPKRAALASARSSSTEAPASPAADTASAEYGTPPGTPALLNARKIAIGNLQNMHIQGLETSAMESVRRSAQATVASAESLVMFSEGTQFSTHSFSPLMRAGMREADACFEGMGRGDAPPFDRALVAAHCIIQRLLQLNAVDSSGKREQRTDPQGLPLYDETGAPIYRKLGESPQQAAPTQHAESASPTGIDPSEAKARAKAEKAKAATLPHNLETKQITALARHYVARSYGFVGRKQSAKQLKKVIENYKVALAGWAHRVLALRIKHGPRMLTVMFNALKLHQRGSESPEDTTAYRTRKGLADVLIGCTPAQRQQLFDLADDPANYLAVCRIIKKSAYVQIKAKYGDEVCYKTKISCARMGMTCLRAALEKASSEPLPRQTESAT